MLLGNKFEFNMNKDIHELNELKKLLMVEERGRKKDKESPNLKLD